MFNLAKQVAKTLPYPIFLRLFYGWYSLRDVREMARLRTSLGVKLLSEIDLSTVKHSDTLAVLGSGSSINGITPMQWQTLSQFDTIGMNFWLFHPFVPRMYMFETLVADTPERYRAFSDISRARAQDYSATLKIATNLAPGFASPAEWQKDLFTFYPVPVPARDEKEISCGLRYLQSRGFFSPSALVKYLYKQGSSLTSCISLAVVLGYRRIILCGIDLLDGACFYQDPALYPEYCDWEFQPRGVAHATESPLQWRVPASAVIREMKSEILDPRGIELFVASRRSALWPRVPELEL